MEESFKRLEDKLDKVIETTTRMEVVTAKNVVILEEHQRRSDALETHVRILESEVDKIKRTKNMAQGAVKFLGFLSGLVIAIEAAIHILRLGK